MVVRRHIYKGPYYQRGQGFASILGGLGSLFRSVLPSVTRGVAKVAANPTVRRVAKKAGQELAKTGTKALEAQLSGNPVKPAVQKQLAVAKKRVAKAAFGSEKHNHCPPKKARHKTKKKAKKKSRGRSLFD